MEFIAALVQALAWPLAIVGVALIFRSKIIELLTPEIKRLKAGPLEVEWERAISEARVELDLPGMVGAPGDLNADLSTPDLADLAQAAPTAAVLEAAGRVESELRERLIGRAPTEDLQVGLVGLARLAGKHEVVTPEMVRAVEGIAVLRDMAAHGRAGDTTPERALDYLHLTDAILYTIRSSG